MSVPALKPGTATARRQGRSGAGADGGAASRPRVATGSLGLPFDPLLLLSIVGICVCSIVTLHTVVDISPDYYAKRQTVYFVFGFLIMLVISRLDYTRLRETKYAMFGFLMVSLVAVMALGDVARGSRRAIQLPFFSFQASELGKILICVCLAAFLTDRARRLEDRDTTARTLLVGLVPAAMIMLQPDLGSSLVFIVITVAILFVAGIPWRHFAALGALGAAAVTVVLVIAPAMGTQVLHGYQKDRLTSFLSPESSSSKEAYQQNQSKIGIGSGEKTGRGDKATQTGYNFLPEHHTDFVYSVVGERWGFVGAATVLSLYALLLWRALRIIAISKNLFGALLAGGIVAMMLFQIFVNVGMTLGIMPITGIPLPLMSYGGSSVVTTFLAMGLLQSIYAQGRAASAGKGRGLTF